MRAREREMQKEIGKCETDNKLYANVGYAGWPVYIDYERNHLGTTGIGRIRTFFVFCFFFVIMKNH